MKGVLLKAISGFYYVKCESGVYECKARGVMRKNGESPVVGDFVEITANSGSYGVVEKILPRKNCLIRPQVANIDKLFIISSFDTPAPNTLLIDRLTAIAVFYGIEPIVVFNKSDLGDFSDFISIYKNAGITCYVVSAKTKDGIENIEKEINGSICAFTGNSGVGKSSLINVLFEGLNLKTGEVSQKLGRGRHTTRHNELYEHSSGGFVADTPGFSSLDVTNMGIEFKEKLNFCFPEFLPYIDKCKFTSCSHTKEKGCAIIQAVSVGKIEPTRYESYLALKEELKTINNWNKNNKK